MHNEPRTESVVLHNHVICCEMASSCWCIQIARLAYEGIQYMISAYKQFRFLVLSVLLQPEQNQHHLNTKVMQADSTSTETTAALLFHRVIISPCESSYYNDNWLMDKSSCNNRFMTYFNRHILPHLHSAFDLWFLYPSLWPSHANWEPFIITVGLHTYIWHTVFNVMPVEAVALHIQTNNNILNNSLQHLG